MQNLFPKKEDVHVIVEPAVVCLKRLEWDIQYTKTLVLNSIYIVKCRFRLK